MRASTWMQLQNIVLSERSQAQRARSVFLYLNEISRIGKPSILPMARAHPPCLHSAEET